jgi:hypothetical protein
VLLVTASSKAPKQSGNSDILWMLRPPGGGRVRKFHSREPLTSGHGVDVKSHNIPYNQLK